MSKRTVIVGGGVAGLAAAARLAATGHDVLVLEADRRLGGRAATDGPDGYRLNLGPHALYARAERLLAELGVEVRGGRPTRGFGIDVRARTHPLPLGALSLVSSAALGWGDKWRLARALAELSRAPDPALDRVSVEEWSKRRGLGGGADALVGTLVRLTSYVNAPRTMSAGAAIRQLRAASEGVRYLDGGWSTIVEGLAARAAERGAVIRARARVESVSIDGRGLEVTEVGGERLRCDGLVLATSPKRAVALLGEAAPEGLRRFASSARPARAACLDVALSRLPSERSLVVLGVDRPLYYSVHSASARLAPEGGAVIHLARYLDPDERLDPAAARVELEGWLDSLQPGWRDALVHARWSPAMTVMPAIPEAAHGGLAGRPPSDCVGRGVALAGDWVGPEGLLVDASLLSAKQAAATLARERARAAA